MTSATKRKIESIVLIWIVCMVSLGACGKGEEDYKKEIATLAEEQGLEDVEVSLEWIEETKTYRTTVESSNFSRLSYSEMADCRIELEKKSKEKLHKSFAMQSVSNNDRYNVLVNFKGAGDLVIEKNDKIIYDKQAGTEENVKDSKTYIISDNPEVGMNKEEVLYQTNWGEPQKKNIGKYTWGTSEQWCYSNNRYVYFENGIVVAVDYEE